MRPVIGDQRSHWQDSFSLIVEKKEGKNGGGGEGGCDAYVSPANTNQLTASLRFHFKENSLLSS